MGKDSADFRKFPLPELNTQRLGKLSNLIDIKSRHRDSAGYNLRYVFGGFPEKIADPVETGFAEGGVAEPIIGLGVGGVEAYGDAVDEPSSSGRMFLP